mmetsp:Transcript_120359/g.300239  ORF Transcript_120359/g.300239 Transcript_120359/m.300239 type:complete len:239 (+) Transcript_120359:1010-1726(+)
MAACWKAWRSWTAEAEWRAVSSASRSAASRASRAALILACSRSNLIISALACFNSCCAARADRSSCSYSRCCWRRRAASARSGPLSARANRNEESSLSNSATRLRSASTSPTLASAGPKLLIELPTPPSSPPKPPLPPTSLAAAAAATLATASCFSNLLRSSSESWAKFSSRNASTWDNSSRSLHNASRSACACSELLSATQARFWTERTSISSCSHLCSSRATAPASLPLWRSASRR